MSARDAKSATKLSSRIANKLPECDMTDAGNADSFVDDLPRRLENPALVENKSVKARSSQCRFVRQLAGQESSALRRHGRLKLFGLN